MSGGPGTIYLLHFDRPYRHADHYVGWTDDLPTRLARHRAGHGARLITIITAAGIGFTLARTTTGDRSTERAIKNAGGARRYCLVCCPRPRTGRWAAGQAAEADPPAAAGMEPGL